MHEVRLDDPARKPRSYTGVIRPEQFVGFARDLDTGAPCDAAGRPFDDRSETTCMVFDSIGEARAFSEAAVLDHPSVRYDIFDAEGRTHPPLLSVLHPSRSAVLDTDPGGLRRRRIIAWCLIVGGIPPIAYAYFRGHDLGAILPALVGINLIIAGGRLLWFNLGIRETERERQERLHKLEH